MKLAWRSSTCSWNVRMPADVWAGKAPKMVTQKHPVFLVSWNRWDGGPCCWGMEEGVWSTLTRIDHCGGRCNVDEARAVADAEADVEVDAGQVSAVEELVRVDRGRACKVFWYLS
jgi:hypothetical protein